METPVLYHHEISIRNPISRALLYHILTAKSLNQSFSPHCCFQNSSHLSVDRSHIRAERTARFPRHTRVSLSIGAGQRIVTNLKILLLAMPFRIYKNPQMPSHSLFIYNGASTVCVIFCDSPVAWPAGMKANKETK